MSWLLIVTGLTIVLAQQYVPLPPLRQQALEQQVWLTERLDVTLPALMKEYGIHAWLLLMQEHAEDTVFWSMKQPTQFAARRRTLILHYFENDVIKHQTIVNFTDQLWIELRETLARVNPQNIALNTDEVIAFADGLHSGQKEKLFQELGDYASRVVYQPLLAVNYIALRPLSMVSRYKQMVENIHTIIREGFSTAVITPGVTTTDDVVWWFRDKMQEIGVVAWFQPSVGIIGRNGPITNSVIMKGDLIWCDIGIVAMGLRTDTQHMAYVLRDGEQDAPRGLKVGLSQSNRMQDILVEEIKPGRTGNDVLKTTLERMEDEGISGLVYTHPIGDWGHSAGPTIGLTDMQGGVPVRGEIKVRTQTWFSIELQARVVVPEYGGRIIEFRQEEDCCLNPDGHCEWAYRRQEKFWLV